MTLLDRPEARLAVAVALGLVIGAERERRRMDSPTPPIAGIRTFAFVALLGAVLALLESPALLAIGALFIGGLVLHAIMGDHTRERGLTTEVAVMLTYALGAFAKDHPVLAFGTGLCVTILLALRAPLHRAVQSVLSEQELLDLLVFGVSAVVILPLVPNRTIDPLGAINLFVLWRLVVVMLALSGLGYVAQRALGPRYGLALAGLGSGFVSSSATIAAMGQRARANPELRRAAIAGATASTIATFVQLAAIIGTAAPALLRAIAVPLGLGGAVAIVYAGFYTLRAARTKAEPERGRAFRIRTALFFAALVSLVAILSTLAQRWMGQAGAVAASAIAAFADAHSATAAPASLAATNQLPSSTAILAILLAISTNTVTKIVLAVSSRDTRFAIAVSVGVVLVLAATWLGYAFLLRM